VQDYVEGKEAGAAAGLPWRVEAADPDNKADKSPEVEVRIFWYL
jgi:hypothetical protein